MTFNENILKIEETINCKLIYLNGLFTIDSVAYLKETIARNKQSLSSNFLLILNSKGGDNVYGDNYLSIREILNEALGNKKLWVLINKEVASTATVVSLSADKLFYLDNNCEIGPIDPQKIETKESYIRKRTKLKLEWRGNRVISHNFKEDHEKLKITIEASMKSFNEGKIIDKLDLDEAFRYLLNINNDFRNHSDRKKINELPEYLNKNMENINQLIPKQQINEIIKELDIQRYNSNFFIYSI